MRLYQRHHRRHKRAFIPSRSILFNKDAEIIDNVPGSCLIRLQKHNDQNCHQSVHVMDCATDLGEYLGMIASYIHSIFAL